MLSSTFADARATVVEGAWDKVIATDGWVEPTNPLP
jgi:hypothetical protein